MYATAADQLDAERADELTVAGRRFRVVRVERLVRIGPDGPRGRVLPIPTPSPPSWCRHSSRASRASSPAKTRTRTRRSN